MGRSEPEEDPMKGKHKRHRQLAAGTVVTAALVALAAPAALARTDPHCSCVHKSPAIASPHGSPWGANIRAVPQADKATTRGYRFTTDTLAPGGGVARPTPVATGFDWGDAGLGASTAAGVLIVLLGAMRLVTHRRNVLAV
jgi:hypothetical protein